MTGLVLGPLLRWVGERGATVWVETAEPCEVTVLGRTERTFAVHGHHYALIDVEGLEPGSTTPYEVHLDGRRVWPEAGSEFPTSVIRTVDPERAPSVAFGSCRIAPAATATHGVDALSAYAHALKDGAEPPTVLLMIGDQVYADGTGERMQAFIRGRRDITEEPGAEIADFEEYTELYRLAWATDPAVRWLFSTVSVRSVFDDHDVRDDWNTSYAWRKEITALPWWRDRIVGGLGAYWLYQHLGNLSPDERRADVLLAEVRAAGDGGAALDTFAERADREPETARWSFRFDLGRTRVVVVDSRAARLLTAERRAMLDDAEHAWFDAQLTGDVDQLLIASSLPFLLPPVIHYAEAWNEPVAARGERGFGEKLRRFADLEHWAAFRLSFDAVARAVLEVAQGARGNAPRSIAFLGGDIHYSYLARAKGGLPIFQIVCSPFRNPLTGVMKWANQLASVRLLNGPARLFARTTGVRRPPFTWHLTDGPWFNNAIATVTPNTVTWQTPNSPTSLRVLHSAALRDD
ncbi:alkaline phosphatase family protein [Actinocorallia sp. API 0066]|uniref:alkaline phosphatase D family protein n=1 Tax=Actinocorallia sp. API 0066 TaxID=2896846 RepID=UPI001E51404F|nr:alkaline phosphatase D family protein [Actinocorallia sp. API 0066]MCD0452692.1 alkaline phosphatase family protein [Actinocorallia sp. API 0066]